MVKASTGSQDTRRTMTQNQEESVALKNLLQKITKQNPEKKNLRQRNKDIFHGKAKAVEEETGAENLAADVDLVAFGVSTKTEPDQLKAFLIGKGLEIENVECMTRPELLEQKLVRSKTMRVTVKASEHAKAMNPDLWPFRAPGFIRVPVPWPTTGRRK